MFGKNASVTKDEMAVIRTRWQTDKRPGFTWLVREMSLPFTPQYLQKVSRKGGWKKDDSFEIPAKSLSELQAPMRLQMVEDALFKSAMGLHEAKEQSLVAGRVVTITRKIPPSVEAQIYLLSRK